jgi:hypothetical protein
MLEVSERVPRHTTEVDMWVIDPCERCGCTFKVVEPVNNRDDFHCVSCFMCGRNCSDYYFGAIYKGIHY